MDTMIQKLAENFGKSTILNGEIYYPNMCHICRCFGQTANLKRCGSCSMISYCCTEHQKQDWPRHEKFCKAISQVQKQWKVFEPLKKIAAKMPSGTCRNLEEFKSLVDLNSYLIISFMKVLRRELTIIEQQMIHFPRVCAVCFESEPELLTNCQKCPQASFCQKHLNDSNHEIECRKILHCYYYSTRKDSFSRAFSLLSDVLEKKDYMGFYEPDVKTLPSSMLDFVETHFLTNLNKLGIKDLELTEEMRSIFTAILSERFSRQFTLLFAIEKLSLNLNSMVIHVVGASNAEQLIIDWEIIFHFLPQLRQLRLVLIGPELVYDLDENLKQIKKGKELIIRPKKALYHEYCQEDDFLKPDMIVCFNPGFHVFETWKKTIQFFNKGQCPLLVTSLHITEGSIGKNLLDSTFPFAKCIYNDSNPFPYISYERESIFLPLAAKNQFMFLYEFLGKNASN